MKKIIGLFKKYVAYRIIELFLFISLIHLILRDVFILFDVKMNPIYLSAPVLIIFLFRRKNIFDLKDFLERFEDVIERDISLVNLFFLDDVDEKYGFSRELIEKEKERNIKRIEKLELKFRFRNIYILFFITMLIYLSLFPLSALYDRDVRQLSFQVFPKDKKVRFSESINLSTDYSGPKNVELFIRKEKEQELKRIQTNRQRVVVDSNIFYSFSVDGRKSDTYEIEVIMPLKLEKAVFRLDYPDYTQMQSFEIFKHSFDVLEGTHIRGLFMFNHRLTKLELITLKGAPELKDNVLSFTAMQDVSFKLRAGDIYDQEYTSDIFKINVKKDHIPKIKVLTPESRRFSIKEGKIPVRAMIGDDYGLRSSALIVKEGEQDTREIELAVYRDNITEVIQTYELKVGLSGSFILKAQDHFSAGYSERYDFVFIDSFAKIKNVIEETSKNVEKIKSLMEKRKSSIRGKKEAIGNMMYKDQISKADENMLSKIIEDFEKMHKEGKRIEDNLKKLQEFAEKENMSGDIIENLMKIREELRNFMQEALINTSQSLSNMVKEKKIRYEEYKKLSARINVEKTRKELKRTLELIQKAKKEAEQQALLDYMDMIIRSQRSNIVYTQKNIKSRQYSILKGIKINQNQITDDMIEISEYIKEPTEHVISMMEEAATLIFNDLESSLKKQLVIVKELEKIRDILKQRIEDRKNSEKRQIKEKLQRLYTDLVGILKRLNKLDRQLKGGLSPRDAGKDFIEIKEAVGNSFETFEEIVRESFILESAYYRNFEETMNFMQRAYKVGKEVGQGVDSYMFMSQRHIMNVGIETAKALHKMDSMESATAMSELMERIKRLQNMQQSMGEEMMELLSGQEMSDSLMDYYAGMQSQIRSELQSLMGGEFSGQLDTIAKEMAEVERQIREKTVDKNELKNKQEEIKKKFRKLMTGLSEKMKKKEYVGKESQKKEFEPSDESTDMGNYETIKSTPLPSDFPEISDMLKKLIKEYLNSI